jgi:hypothetical protein
MRYRRAVDSVVEINIDSTTSGHGIEHDCKNKHFRLRIVTHLQRGELNTRKCDFNHQ